MVLRIAIVPNTHTFEKNYGHLGVTSQDLADGKYRGTWIAQYARAWRASGHAVTLVVPSRNPGFVVGSLLNINLVKISSLYSMMDRMWRWKLRPIGAALSSRYLPAALEDYDLVYVQEYATGRFAYLSRKIAHGKIVAAHHGTSITDAPFWVKREVTEFRGRLTTCNSAERDLVSGCAKRAEATVYVPNWPELEWLQGPVLEQRSPGRIVWTGRLDAKIKNLWVLLDAMEAVLENFPNAHLDIVGSGADYLSLSRRVAESSRLSRSVTFHGRVDERQKLLDLVGSADLFVNCSVQEGFPIAVIEAGYSGCKLVLSDLPYVSEELSDLDCAWTFDANDAEAFKTAIENAIKANVSRAEIAAWFQTRFSQEASIDLLEVLMQRRPLEADR